MTLFWHSRSTMFNAFKQHRKHNKQPDINQNNNETIIIITYTYIYIYIKISDIPPYDPQQPPQPFLVILQKIVVDPQPSDSYSLANQKVWL